MVVPADPHAGPPRPGRPQVTNTGALGPFLRHPPGLRSEVVGTRARPQLPSSAAALRGCPWRREDSVARGGVGAEPGPWAGLRGRPHGIHQAAGPTERRARTVKPAPSSANQGKLRHRKAQAQLGSLPPQGPRRKLHLSRDPGNLNLNSSPP